MTDEQNIGAHESVTIAPPGLMNRGGSICRFLDFAPESELLLHWTRNLDYGVVLEDEIELVVDSGEGVTLRHGDTAVRQGTTLCDLLFGQVLVDKHVVPLLEGLHWLLAG